MSQTVQNILQELTTLIQDRLQSAQDRAQQTENERMGRYYKGQADTLRLVLHDIDALKFEFGMELGAGAIPEPPVQEEMPSVETKQEKPAKTRGRAQKPKAPVFNHKALAQEAIERGVIARKISHFYYDLLPDKHVKGYDALYQAFEDSEELRQAVKNALETLPEEAHLVAEETQPEGSQHREQAHIEVSPVDPHAQHINEGQPQNE